ncbi:copper transporter 6-like [Canna indica]|uniref:Copper transport protein n=1 Tax=Canna indica TaxID=4628 RepID=A0AAQ3KUW5_9LILI|nr:copper transporter 6-like [Canna indica]
MEMEGMSPPAPGCMPSYSMSEDMMMRASLFWGTHVQILFARWPGKRGVGFYVLALVLVFVTSALVDGLSLALNRLPRRRLGWGPVPVALLLTVIHATRVGLGYLVMLAVMSFNVGVLIAAIAGHTLGFLISGSGLVQGSGPFIGRPNNNGIIAK